MNKATGLGSVVSVLPGELSRPLSKVTGHCAQSKTWVLFLATSGLSPSMRRPVDVKAHFRFLLYMSLFPFSQAASVAILPSALFCERDSLGARWVFSFQ